MMTLLRPVVLGCGVDVNDLMDCLWACASRPFVVDPADEGDVCNVDNPEEFLCSESRAFEGADSLIGGVIFGSAAW